MMTTDTNAEPISGLRGTQTPSGLRLTDTAEMSCVTLELEHDDDDPLALDPQTIADFVAKVMRRAGRDRLDLRTHGFFLQIDPLVLLLEGRVRNVKRTACIALRDDAPVGSFEQITFPASMAFERVIPDGVPLDRAVDEALRAAREWVMAGGADRIGGFVRLHVIPAPTGATTVLRIERLRPAADED